MISTILYEAVMLSSKVYLFGLMHFLMLPSDLMYHILTDKGKRIKSDRDIEKKSRREGKIV